MVGLIFAFLAGLSLDPAREQYFAAAEGDKSAAAAAARAFEKLAAEHPSDPVIRAYLGSVRLLQSKHALAPWTKGRLAKEGLKLLDDATASGILETRFVRAATTFHLPGIFGREEQCAEDLAALAPRAGELPPRMAAAAVFYHGAMLEKKGRKADAVEAWKRAAAAWPDMPAGKSAAARLRK